MIALFLHCQQVGIAIVKERRGRQGRDAVQLTQRPKNFIIREGIFAAVMVQLFTQRHLQLRIFILMTANHAQPIDKLEPDRKIAQRAATVQQRFDGVFHRIIVFAEHLKHQNIDRLGQ